MPYATMCMLQVAHFSVFEVLTATCATCGTSLLRVAIGVTHVSVKGRNCVKFNWVQINHMLQIIFESLVRGISMTCSDTQTWSHGYNRLHFL